MRCKALQWAGSQTLNPSSRFSPFPWKASPLSEWCSPPMTNFSQVLSTWIPMKVCNYTFEKIEPGSLWWWKKTTREKCKPQLVSQSNFLGAHGAPMKASSTTWRKSSQAAGDSPLPLSLAMWIDFPMEVWKSRWKSISVSICSEHTMPSLPIFFDLNQIGSWQKNCCKIFGRVISMNSGNFLVPNAGWHTKEHHHASLFRTYVEMPSLPIRFDFSRTGIGKIAANSSAGMRSMSLWIF